jgi:hypothetical protein
VPDRSLPLPGIYPTIDLRGGDPESSLTLPALWPGQPLSLARGSKIDAAIRDSGAFLDPRSRKDWWQSR